jgi:transcriptional regulator with AAA-type ATPase domain
MNDSTDPTLLSFSDSDRSPLSIRARALVFVDPRSCQLRDCLEQLAPTGLPVLVQGESGSGKELLARNIHRESQRHGLFVPVSCGALSPTWAEAELFGHSGGGAPHSAASRAGWFGSANGGTLYLDEIGDLPRALQDRLLQALEHHEVVRVGAQHPSPVDVRLVAATSVDLQRAVRAGHFSERLYQYLQEGHLHLPPLRERPLDILPMAEYFLGVYSQRLQLKLPQLSCAARQALQAYPWPGNTRELENVIHFGLLVCDGEQLLPEHLDLLPAFGNAFSAA